MRVDVKHRESCEKNQRLLERLSKGPASNEELNYDMDLKIKMDHQAPIGHASEACSNRCSQKCGSGPCTGNCTGACSVRCPTKSWCCRYGD